MKRSIAEKIKDVKVDKRYTMRTDDMHEPKDNSHGIYELISNSFRFGYLQGTKAAKAEIR